MGFLFSDQNLFRDKYLINDKDIADILNVCLNYGGDLGSELYDIKNSDLLYMDNLYAYSFTILNQNFNLSAVSNKISNTSNIFKNILEDVRLVGNAPNDNTITPNGLLTEMRRWSDVYAGNSYQNIFNCKTITRDFWTVKDSFCTPEFEYRSFSKIISGKEFIGGTNCLIVDEWADSYLTSRYSENPYDCDNGDPTKGKSNAIKDNDFDTINSAIYSYWESIKRYNKWHKSTLNSIIIDINE